jgi:transposase InsO family protein
LETIGRRPAIFNTDHGSQFTGAEWTGWLAELGVKVSMDWRGRWMDTVLTQRLWRSAKIWLRLSFRPHHPQRAARRTDRLV